MSVRQFEPFLVEYHILNVSERAINAIVRLATEAGKNPPADFMVAGEVRSFVNLMPADSEYVLTYTMIPLKLGLRTLPSISIEDRMMEIPKRSADSKKEEAEYRCLIDQFTSEVHVTSA